MWRRTLPGAVLPGTVASLADFGAFVDLGGIQGRVPVSEITALNEVGPFTEMGVQGGGSLWTTLHPSGSARSRP